ncbi:MAG: NAD(P)/FAD-dependent oxidoreductase, partial [Cyclonatronaceae bacterium]
AVQMGKYVAKILSKDESAKNRAMRAPFKYVDKGTMATIGRARAVADIKGLHLSGFIAWALWSVVHVLFLVGFRNRLNVFVEWIWFYFTFRRGIRLITDRPEEKITEMNPVERL